MIEEYNIVPLVADLTEANPEAEEMLQLLDNSGKALPFVAIFPADNPNKPILLDGLITQGQILKALRQAGPSHVNGRTAMRQGDAATN